MQNLKIGTAAILIVLSGCHKQVGGQVVATVNNDEITQQQLNLELQGLSLPNTASNDVKQKAVGKIVERLVDRELLVQQAKAQNLDKQPEYLTELLKLQDELLIKLLTAKLSKNIALPDAAAVDKFIADNPSMFVGRRRYALDQLAFPTPKDPSVLASFKPAHSLDAIATILTAHGIKFVRGKGQLDSAAIPANTAKEIAALPPGEPFVVNEPGQVIASVITAVTQTPLDESQAKPVALRLLREKAINAALQAQLTQAKASAKIQYQAGFAPPAK